MTDDQKKLWMERFSGMREKSPEERKAWIAEYDALSDDDKAVIEMQRAEIEERAEQVVDNLHAICDKGAETVIKDYDPTATAIDLESATFALLYRIVNGWNNSISILPPILYEVAESNKQILAGDIETRTVLGSIDTKLGTLLDQMAQANKQNERVINGLAALYKLQKGDKIV